MPLEENYFLACPWCLEHFQVRVDRVAGTTSYTEDCEVCCHPVSIDVVINDGLLTRIEGRREND